MEEGEGLVFSRLNYCALKNDIISVDLHSKMAEECTPDVASRSNGSYS